MATPKSLTLIFLLQALLAAISIPLAHCTRSFKYPNDDNLLKYACTDTPNYNLCLRYLRADPRSTEATDVAGLGLVLVKAMTGKAIRANSRIQELLQGKRLGARQRQALTDCAKKYYAIRVGDIPQATEALQKGNPKFAEDGARDAAIEATSCEEGFPAGKSPLTLENTAMHDLAAITASMVRKLL